MLGVDIIKISRVYKLEDDFPLRVLSKEEADRYLSFEDEEEKARFLATRWAAKEAYVKASGDKTIDFRRISIITDIDGKPHLYVDNIEVGEVSLSHDHYALAVVLLWENNNARK